MALGEDKGQDQMDKGLATNMSDSSSGHHWNIFGHTMPKSEIVFFMQVLLIYVVVIASIVNLTLYKDEGKLWTALLSSALGYLLPNPTLNK